MRKLTATGIYRQIIVMAIECIIPFLILFVPMFLAEGLCRLFGVG